MARVAVVGGGLAGCASAARLAKLGHDVTLVEALPTLGGAIGVTSRDGFEWDTGPNTTALPAVLRDLFRKSGRPLERELDLVPVQPMREHRFTDGTRLSLPSGSRSEQMQAIDEALGSGAGKQWADYVHAQAEVWDVLRRDYLERPWSATTASKEARDLLRSRLMMHKAVTKSFKDKRLQTLAWHHSVQGGHDPRNVPAWFGIVDYLEQNFGTWTFPGGFGRLAELLTKRLGERGVSVMTGTTAKDLATGPQGPHAVETTSGTVECDKVVVAIDPRRLPALRRHVERSMPAIPPAVCHVGLTQEVPDMPREIVVHDDYVISVRTDGRAPAGKSAWTLVGRGKLSEDLVMALARKRIDLRDLVETRIDLSPRQLVEHWSGSPAGVLWQGRATVTDRLSVETPLPGVYAAGAHTGGGGWVPFVGLTAAVVADAIGPAQ
jgi:phytoene dehydrogenase-like protein